jgi:hypothetical protein
MSEPTPVNADGEVIGLPPNPPPEDQTVVIEPEPIVIDTPPQPTPGMVVDGDE